MHGELKIRSASIWEELSDKIPVTIALFVRHFIVCDHTFFSICGDDAGKSSQFHTTGDLILFQHKTIHKYKNDTK